MISYGTLTRHTAKPRHQVPVTAHIAQETGMTDSSAHERKGETCKP